MTTTTYQYQPIAASDTIRLIHLQPAPSLETEINCSLVHVSLKSCAEDILEHYVALSYVWGDASLQRTIVVDDRPLAITASLHCALRHLRDESRLVRVWADGVCIDQNSIEDRNAQVAMMGSIYPLATHTIIFLGEPTMELDRTMRLLKLRISGTNPMSTKGSLETLIQDNVLNRLWFSRVWVLQELVLSVSPWLQGGKYRIKWDEFSRCISMSDLGTWKPHSHDLLGECHSAIL